MSKEYSLIELFNFEEGTRFITNFDNENATFEVWIEDKTLKIEPDEHIQVEYDGDNRAFITNEWLQSTFILKDEDKKILDINIREGETEKPFPKVFKMDDYSWVCAMDLDKAVKWYLETTGIEEEELDIKECDLDKDTMYSEISISEIVERLEKMSNQDEDSFSIIKRSGELFIKEPFREVINFMIHRSGYESIVSEPFEICTTEW